MDTKETSPLFSFIIVNYRSVAHLPACFSSFRNITIPEAFECLIANNDPSEEMALQKLRDRFPFSLVSLPENRGFGFAANRAARRARGQILVFLNPDARFLSGNMDEVFRHFTSTPSIGAIGLRLLLEPEMPQPWSAGSAVTFFDLLRNHIGFPRSARFWNTPFSRSVAWTSGAALAIPRSFFFRIHGFDESFFLYYEDTDLCFRLRRLKKHILILPSIRLLHIGGASMNPSRHEQKKSYFTSQDRYFSLHRPRYEGILLKILRKMTGKPI